MEARGCCSLSGKGKQAGRSPRGSHLSVAELAGLVTAAEEAILDDLQPRPGKGPMIAIADGDFRRE
jgi:hypothetical protein